MYFKFLIQKKKFWYQCSITYILISSVYHYCYNFPPPPPFLVPAGQGSPNVDGFNSSTMLVTWDPPVLQNGPDPSYQVQRVVTALSGNPPRVEKGARFTGAGYYLFSGTILPYSAYTGKWEWNLSITPVNSNGAISDYHIFLNKQPCCNLRFSDV